MYEITNRRRSLTCHCVIAARTDTDSRHVLSAHAQSDDRKSTATPLSDVIVVELDIVLLAALESNARMMPGFTTSSVCVGLLLVVFSNSEFHRSHIASFFSLRCCMSSENDFALQGQVKYTNILKLSRKLFKRSTWIVERENCAR